MKKYSKKIDYKKLERYIVDRGSYKDHEYVIKWNYNCPEAYVKPKCYLDKREIKKIIVHDGCITYLGKWCFSLYALPFEDAQDFIGWNYAHEKDYVPLVQEDGYKKYTYEDIMKDIKKVINHLCILRASYKDLMLFDRLGGK